MYELSAHERSSVEQAFANLTDRANTVVADLDVKVTQFRQRCVADSPGRSIVDWGPTCGLDRKSVV